MIKLAGLIDKLHTEITQASQLNRNAVLAQELLKNQIQNSRGDIEIFDQGRKIKIKENIYYEFNHNLYIKQPKDKAVELLAGIKNFKIIKLDDSRVNISFVIYPKERFYETQRVYFNNRINLNFSVQYDSAV